MGTRGLFGFRKNETDKAVYNHFDSYPEYLGLHFVDLIKRVSVDKLENYFDKIKVVSSDKEPTEDEIQYCINQGWCDLSVSDRNTKDWYCLLHNLQGLDIWEKTIAQNQPVYIENSIDFIRDSLFCEYAYLLNFDDKVLECYKGFQKEPTVDNRYGGENHSGYYPCKLTLKIPFQTLQDKTSDEIVQMMLASY